MSAGQAGGGQHSADSLPVVEETVVVDGGEAGRRRHDAPCLEKLPTATNSSDRPRPASRRGAQVAAARARGWPAGRGRRGGSGKLLAWLRMNFSFQKRALELKGAIQSVCWGAPCPQRGSGWAPECRPGKGRPCVPGAPVPEPGGGGGQLDTVELSIKVGSGCLSLEG